MEPEKSFVEQVRDAFRQTSGKNVRTQELARILDLICDKHKRPLYRALIDLRKSNEVRRVRPGVYDWIGKPDPEVQIRKVMWRILRARRTVTVEDLMELSEASETYVREFLQMLARREVVRKISGPRNPDGGFAWTKYRMVNDPGPELPDDREKTERLRRIRLRKKEALAALDAANLAISKARKAVSEISGGDHQ